MVGIKGFEVAEAERALMHTFWEKGYVGTSIGDLEAATGLKRGSLYNAFGDKASMFAVAFARYGEEVEDSVLALFNREDLLAGAEAMLTALVAGGGPHTPPGCLISRMAGEIGGIASAEGERVRARLEATEAQIKHRLSSAVANKRLRPDADVAVLARMLAGTMRAVTLLAGTGTKQTAEAMAKLAIERLRVEVV